MVHLAAAFVTTPDKHLERPSPQYRQSDPSSQGTVWRE